MPTPPIVYPVAVIRRQDGATKLLHSEAELVAAIPRLIRDGGIAREHVQTLSGRFDGELPPASWILRDDFGQPVNFPALRRSRYAEVAKVAKLRPLPHGVTVPCTGRRSRHRWYRRLNTQNVRRANGALDLARADADGGRLTGCSPGRVPSSWDDLPRRAEHNWKSQRRTQWRA